MEPIWLMLFATAACRYQVISLKATHQGPYRPLWLTWTGHKRTWTSWCPCPEGLPTKWDHPTGLGRQVSIWPHHHGVARATIMALYTYVYPFSVVYQMSYFYIDPDNLCWLEAIGHVIHFVEFGWRFYALPASIYFQGENIQSYSLFNPVMMITWWMKLGGNLSLGLGPYSFDLVEGERAAQGVSMEVLCKLSVIWSGDLFNFSSWTRLLHMGMYCRKLLY